MSYYAQKTTSSTRLIGIGVVAGLHLFIGWAVVSGFGSRLVEKVMEPITTEIIEEVVIPEEEPPPPPPPTDVDLAPPPDMVIMPEITFDTPPPPTAIQQVEKAREITAPPPPRPAAPPPTPQPRASVIKKVELPRRFGESMERYYPRESIQLEEEGISTVRFCVDAKGKVTSAQVTKSSGFPRLDEATVKMISEARGIKPGTEDGVPQAESCLTAPVQWTLKRR